MRSSYVFALAVVSSGCASATALEEPPPRPAIAWLAPSTLLADADETADDEVPACISVEAEARYRNFGYDHIVHLASRCDADVSCTVSTDVAPAPIVVLVRPGARVEVLTFRGSPQRTFTPHVLCRAAPPSPTQVAGAP
jgi:hypothetical protein